MTDQKVYIGELVSLLID